MAPINARRQLVDRYAMCRYRKGCAHRGSRGRFFGNPKPIDTIVTASTSVVPSDRAGDAVWMRSYMHRIIFFPRRMLFRLNSFKRRLCIVQRLETAIGTGFSLSRWLV